MIWRCAQEVTQNFSSTTALICIGMRQSVPFYSTSSGNSKFSSFLVLGLFLDLFRRIYIPVTYIHLAQGGGGGGGGEAGGGEGISHITRTGMLCVNSEENLQKIPVRSLRRL